MGTAQQDAAAAKIQAIKKGKSAREDVEKAKAARKVQTMQRGKKARKGGEKLLKAIERMDVGMLQKMLADGAVAGPDVLKAALASPARALAAVLIGEQDAWGIEEKQLAVWNKVQAASKPPADEEEEAEEVDVAGEEWQAETAKEVYGEGEADAKYFVQQVVTLGCYAGERKEWEEDVEMPFDTAVAAREGYGVALMPKGAVYAGAFVEGVREGVGVYKYTDGTCYCGEWKANAKHGEGRMLYKDGSVYEGAWRYNKRHGHGVYTYANGDVYVGMWFTGAKHGKGKYRSAGVGSRFTGVWANGALVTSSVQTQDGSHFFSGFTSGVPAGPGAFALSNGALVTGAHAMAPPNPDLDEEEAALAPKTSTWAGGAVIDADHMTTGKLGAEYGAGGKPPAAKALIVGVSAPPSFPELDLAPAAAQLKSALTDGMGMAEGDVTMLETEKCTKEGVTEALTELAGKLGRGDVAFVALLCHGKKLADVDNEELEEKEEGLCLADEVLGSDELGELIALFDKSSAHLFLYLDSCFDGACLQAPPPNFCCLTAGLQAHEKPAEGATSQAAYWASNMTAWLAPALEAAKPTSYAALLEGVLAQQAAADSRTATKQLPKIYCRDAEDAVLKPMA